MNECFTSLWPQNCEYNVGQSHCTVIVAWMYHFQYKPCEWDANHLDNILCNGDMLRILFLCENEDEPKKDVLRNIKAACQPSREFFFCEPVFKLSFFGKFTGFRSKLNKYMDNCDETSRSVLFICKKISFGIFGYLGHEGGVEYCLFDPHGRNSDGFFDYTGNSCVLNFHTIDEMVNLLARDEIFAHCTYECIPLKKRTGTYTNEALYVIVRNSEKFVERYRNRDDCAELSEYSDEYESEDSDIDMFDIPDECGQLECAVSSMVTTIENIRTVKPPERYQCVSDQSFHRGKLRQNRKSSKRRWKKWDESMNAQMKKLYNQRKYRMQQLRLRHR